MGGKEADFEWDFNCKCPLSKDQLTTGIAVRETVFVVLVTQSVFVLLAAPLPQLGLSRRRSSSVLRPIAFGRSSSIDSIRDGEKVGGRRQAEWLCAAGQNFCMTGSRLELGGKRYQQATGLAPQRPVELNNSEDVPRPMLL